MLLDLEASVNLSYSWNSYPLGYVFEAWDHTHNRKVALKRIEKVGTQLSREYEILFELRDCEHVVKILVTITLILYH